MATVVGKNSRGGLKKVAKNTKSTGGASSTAPINYNFDSTKETATQYNQRIASARGDSTSELNSMQNATNTAYKAKGLDVNRLTSATLNPTAPWIAPTKTTPTDVGNMAGAGNAGVATGMTDVKLNDKGMFENIPLTEGSALKYALDNAPQMPNLEKQYLKSKEYKDVTNAQKEVNNYTSQLNQITASSQAQQLALEGQGRGQTESFVGGEQARINREAAIAALPVQAQLAAAQGNLDFAQKQLNTVFTLRQQDAQNKFKFETDRLNTIVSFLDKAETRQYNERMKTADREYQKTQDNINYLRQLSAQARENGNTSVIGQLGALDPASATFEQDVARISQGIRKPVTRSFGETKNFGTADKPDWRERNLTTGAWEPVQGVGSTGNKNNVNSQLSAVDENINRMKSLLSNTAGIKGSSGNYQPDFFGNAFTGSFNGVTPEDGLITNLFKYTPIIGNVISANVATNKKNDFLTGVSYVVNNQTFDKLKELKQGGATFGALSDSERVAIGRAASDLASSVITDQSGNVTGFRGSERNLVSNLTKVLEGYKAARDQINIENGLEVDDIQSGYSYWSSLPSYSVTNY
jgi:hypothetical protein